MSTGSFGGQVGTGIVERVAIILRSDGVSFGVFAFVPDFFHLLFSFFDIVIVVLVSPPFVLRVDVHLTRSSRLVLLLLSTSFRIRLCILFFSPAGDCLLPDILRQAALRPSTSSFVSRSGGRTTWQRGIVLVVASRRSTSAPERSQSSFERASDRSAFGRSGRTSHRSGSTGEGRVVGVVASVVFRCWTASRQGGVVEIVASRLSVDEIRAGQRCWISVRIVVGDDARSESMLRLEWRARVAGGGAAEGGRGAVRKSKWGNGRLRELLRLSAGERSTAMSVRGEAGSRREG